MGGNAFEQAGIGERLICNAVFDQAPDIVIVAGQAGAAFLVCRPVGLFVQQHDFFPERAAWRQGAHSKPAGAEQVGNCAVQVGFDLGCFGGVDVRSRAEFDLDPRGHVVSRTEHRRVMKQQGLIVRVVGIGFELPDDAGR